MECALPRVRGGGCEKLEQLIEKIFSYTSLASHPFLSTIPDEESQLPSSSGLCALSAVTSLLTAARRSAGRGGPERLALEPSAALLEPVLTLMRIPAQREKREDARSALPDI